jgi:hypothetical protein
MNDLVKRLHKRAFVESKVVADELTEAANRIKALEAALREIAASTKIIAKGEDMETALKVMLSSHQKTARSALGEKKDEYA